MTGSYSDVFQRDGSSADLPRELAVELIGDAQRQSVALTLARQVPTVTRDSRVPQVSALPSAYWVTGDTGLKQTTALGIEEKPLIAEEIATIAVIPDAVIADSEYDLWGATRPYLAQAIGRTLDAAFMFGVNKPSSWGPCMLETAQAAGMVFDYADWTGDDTDDPVPPLLSAAEAVGDIGYIPNGAVTRPGFQYRAARVRSRDLLANPVGSDSPFNQTIAGLGLRYDPLYWNPAYLALVADWTNVIVGLRQDITITPSKSAVITDETGKVVMNAYQQDSTMVRVVMRVGGMVATPDTGYDVSNGLTGTTGFSPVAFMGAQQASGDSARRTASPQAASKAAPGRRAQH